MLEGLQWASLTNFNGWRMDEGRVDESMEGRMDGWMFWSILKWFQIKQDFAAKIFENADREDRAGKASKKTALAYYAATIFMEVSFHHNK
jgi:hypothetical protein